MRENRRDEGVIECRNRPAVRAYLLHIGEEIRPWSYVDGAAWGKILAEFHVERRNIRLAPLENPSTVVSLKTG